MNAQEYNAATPNPLAAYERAARLYCAKLGLDPDEELDAPHPLGFAVRYTRLQWEFAAEKLIDLSQMLTALREAQSPIVPPKAN